jgi:hypothetical protein
VKVIGGGGMVNRIPQCLQTYSSGMFGLSVLVAFCSTSPCRVWQSGQSINSWGDTRTKSTTDLAREHLGETRTTSSG